MPVNVINIPNQKPPAPQQQQTGGKVNIVTLPGAAQQQPPSNNVSLLVAPPNNQPSGRSNGQQTIVVPVPMSNSGGNKCEGGHQPIIITAPAQNQPPLPQPPPPPVQQPAPSNIIITQPAAQPAPAPMPSAPPANMVFNQPPPQTTIINNDRQAGGGIVGSGENSRGPVNQTTIVPPAVQPQAPQQHASAHGFCSCHKCGCKFEPKPWKRRYDTCPNCQGIIALGATSHRTDSPPAQDRAYRDATHRFHCEHCGSDFRMETNLVKEDGHECPACLRTTRIPPSLRSFQGRPSWNRYRDRNDFPRDDGRHYVDPLPPLRDIRGGGHLPSTRRARFLRAMSPTNDGPLVLGRAGYGCPPRNMLYVPDALERSFENLDTSPLRRGLEMGLERHSRRPARITDALTGQSTILPEGLGSIVGTGDIGYLPSNQNNPYAAAVHEDGLLHSSNCPRRHSSLIDALDLANLPPHLPERTDIADGKFHRRRTLSTPALSDLHEQIPWRGDVRVVDPQTGEELYLPQDDDILGAPEGNILGAPRFPERDRLLYKNLLKAGSVYGPGKAYGDGYLKVVDPKTGEVFYLPKHSGSRRYMEPGRARSIIDGLEKSNGGVPGWLRVVDPKTGDVLYVPQHSGRRGYMDAGGQGYLKNRGPKFQRLGEADAGMQGYLTVFDPKTGEVHYIPEYGHWTDSVGSNRVIREKLPGTERLKDMDPMSSRATYGPRLERQGHLKVVDPKTGEVSYLPHYNHVPADNIIEANGRQTHGNVGRSKGLRYMDPNRARLLHRPGMQRLKEGEPDVPGYLKVVDPRTGEVFYLPPKTRPLPEIMRRTTSYPRELVDALDLASIPQPSTFVTTRSESHPSYVMDRQGNKYSLRPTGVTENRLARKYLPGFDISGVGSLLRSSSEPYLPRLGQVHTVPKVLPYSPSGKTVRIIDESTGEISHLTDEHALLRLLGQGVTPEPLQGRPIRLTDAKTGKTVILPDGIPSRLMSKVKVSDVAKDNGKRYKPVKGVKPENVQIRMLEPSTDPTEEKFKRVLVPRPPPKRLAVPVRNIQVTEGKEESPSIMRLQQNTFGGVLGQIPGLFGTEGKSNPITIRTKPGQDGEAQVLKLAQPRRQSDGLLHVDLSDPTRQVLGDQVGLVKKDDPSYLTVRQKPRSFPKISVIEPSTGNQPQLPQAIRLVQTTVPSGEQLPVIVQKDPVVVEKRPGAQPIRIVGRQEPAQRQPIVVQQRPAVMQQQQPPQIRVVERPQQQTVVPVQRQPVILQQRPATVERPPQQIRIVERPSTQPVRLIKAEPPAQKPIVMRVNERPASVPIRQPLTVALPQPQLAAQPIIALPRQEPLALRVQAPLQQLQATLQPSPLLMNTLPAAAQLLQQQQLIRELALRQALSRPVIRPVPIPRPVPVPRPIPVPVVRPVPVPVPIVRRVPVPIPMGRPFPIPRPVPVPMPMPMPMSMPCAMPYPMCAPMCPPAQPERRRRMLMMIRRGNSGNCCC